MIKLKILKVKKNHEYILQEIKSKAEHSLIINFYDTKAPKVGDFIRMHESLLNRHSENFAQPYFFANLFSDYGRDIEFLREEEVICLYYKDSKVILKRIYG